MLFSLELPTLELAIPPLRSLKIYMHIIIELAKTYLVESAIEMQWNAHLLYRTYLEPDAADVAFPPPEFRTLFLDFIVFG